MDDDDVWVAPGWVYDPSQPPETKTIERTAVPRPTTYTQGDRPYVSDDPERYWRIKAATDEMRRRRLLREAKLRNSEDPMVRARQYLRDLEEMKRQVDAATHHQRGPGA